MVIYQRVYIYTYVYIWTVRFGGAFLKKAGEIPGDGFQPMVLPRPQ